MSLSDVLEDAAAEAVTGRTLDAGTVIARAERPEYRPVLRPVVGLGAPRWRPRRGLPRHPVARGLLVAASVAAVVTLVLAALPAVQRAAPRPATTPTAPGTLPSWVRVPPAWTPTLTEQPVSRAVYVGNADTGAPWVVGADAGEYRVLPLAPGSSEATSVALSPDGTRVAWSSDSRYGAGTRLDVVDVPTGARRTLGLPGSGRRGFSMAGLAFSPDGASIAVWGSDRLVGRDAPAVLVVDAVRGRVAQPPCWLADAEFGAVAAAWGGPTRVLTAGCTFQGPSLPSGAMIRGLGPVTTEVTGGLPAAPGDLWSGTMIGSPVGAGAAAPVTAADGRTRWSVSFSETGAYSGRLTLTRTGAAAGPASTGLGEASGAVPLAATAGGVLVSRWTIRPTQSGFLGPGEVVIVRGGGRVDVVTRSGDRARIAAVAGDVAARARAGGPATVGPRVLDTAWWSWTADRVIGWIPWPGSSFWWIVGAVGVAGVVGRLTVRVLPGRRGARWTGVALVVVATGGLLLVPTEMPRAAVPGAGPVVPKVLRDQRLQPPRAFDEIGAPRTTAVGVVVVGVVAGRRGVYATDAATGALVRLDDLPGLGPDDGVPGEWPGNLAVSPNGRWLSDGGVVVDLSTARYERLADPPQAYQASDQLADNVVAFDDGSVAVAGSSLHRLWVYPPPVRLDSSTDEPPADAVRPTQVARTEGVFAISGAGPGRVVMRLLGEVLAKETDPSVFVVDYGAPGSEATPERPVLTPVTSTQFALVAAREGWTALAGPDGLALTPSGRPVPTAGGVDAAWLVEDPANPAEPGTVVALGADTGADVAVTRTSLTGSAVAVPVTVTRIDLPGLTQRLPTPTDVTVAAEVVARATPVDVPADPWWAAIPRP